MPIQGADGGVEGWLTWLVFCVGRYNSGEEEEEGKQTKLPFYVSFKIGLMEDYLTKNNDGGGERVAPNRVFMATRKLYYC